MTISPSAASVVGRQVPRVRKVVPYATDASGQEAIELYESTGERLDPWQKLVLLDGCGERPDGRWAAFEVATVVPRQNGKGTIIEAREMSGLYLFGSRMIIHSAHEFKTAAEGFRRVKTLIDNTDDLRRKVKKITEAHGEEGIELLSGARLRFMARTRGSGRGFSGDDLMLDEAYNLSPQSMAAMIPTLAARPNPQIWYFSSAPLVDSDQLRRIVKRGRDGDPDDRLTYFEWSAPPPADGEDADLDDLEHLAMANPGLGIRLSAEFCRTERMAMDPTEYARERLGIEENLVGKSLFNMRVWEMLQEKTGMVGRIVLAFDMDNDREWASIGAAGAHPTPGLIQAELIENRPGHPGWLVDRMVELNRRHRPLMILVNGNSPANTEITAMEAKGLKIHKVTAPEMATACGQFYDHVRSDPGHSPTGRFAPSKRLTASVAATRKRDLGDTGGFAWRRKDADADITPITTITLAMWGLKEFGAKKKSSPMAAFV